jgi:DHA1 family tetracycline resistance protein-like MFS transporter
MDRSTRRIGRFSTGGLFAFDREKMKHNRYLISIFLIVFIDLLGFSLILPLLPFYAETFGAAPIMIGLLVAVYAAAQFFSAPLLGRISDRIGRRPVLLISIAGNMIAFIILGFAHNLAVLFVARTLAGIFGGNLSVAQAYITDVTDEKDRSRGLGLIGAAFGLGFIMGPALGGMLSQFGFGVPSFLAAGLSIVNLLLVALWLPESLTVEKITALSDHHRPAINISALMNALRQPGIGPLLQNRFWFALAFNLFTSVFALYAQYRLNFDSRQTGYLLAYIGFLSVIVQGVLVGRITQKFDDKTLLFSMTLLMSIGLLGWAFIQTLGWLLLDLAILAFAGGMFNTVINSAISKAVAPIEVGGTLGLASSLESATRIFAPSLGGLLIQTVNTGAPGIFGAVILAVLAVFTYFRLKLQPQHGSISIVNP